MCLLISLVWVYSWNNLMFLDYIIVFIWNLGFWHYKHVSETGEALGPKKIFVKLDNLNTIYFLVTNITKHKHTEVTRNPLCCSNRWWTSINKVMENRYVFLWKCTCQKVSHKSKGMEYKTPFHICFLTNSWP